MTVPYYQMQNYVTDLPEGVTVAAGQDYSSFGSTGALSQILSRVKPLALDQLLFDQAVRDAHNQLVAQRLDWSCGQAIAVEMEGLTVYEPADCYAKVNASWAIAKCQQLGIPFNA